ncbi:AAA family ATPase [Agromyces sp. NPDC058126]|uniref:AAA family ATPase n=1 Tax=Agromyces sp. NPDC058126 TaxID=3346350 RepID=UPI0036D98CF8
MNRRRLQSITVSNFRSIAGEVRIPLDAPVVLLHGMNGVGKTSVLTAIEFALTGSVESMKRVDAEYESHLVRHGAADASVSISLEDSDGVLIESTRKFESDQWRGFAPLNEPSASHFSERCYLAQSTLGRLLEIYENSTSDKDSALARFVKDVLHLDALDSLIAGLHSSGDIRRLRTLVPEFAELERDVRMSKRSLKEEEGSLSELASAKARAVAEVVDLASSISTQATPTVDEESEIGRLLALRRELAGVRSRLAAAAGTKDGMRLAEAESAVAAMSVDVERWWSGPGRAVEGALEIARTRFSSIPFARVVGPSEAVRSALASLQSEADRLQSRISADDVAIKREADLRSVLEHLGARRERISHQQTAITKNASEVARLLAELVPHIAEDDCPVCGRDFSEISPEPLEAVVLRRASELAAEAQTMSELAAADRELSIQHAETNRELAAAAAVRLSAAERSISISDLASISSSISELHRLQDEADLGTDKIATFAKLQDVLAAIRSDDQMAHDARRFVEAVKQEFNLEGLVDSDSTAQALLDVDRAIEGSQRVLENQVATRRLLREKQSAAAALSGRVEEQRDAFAAAKKILDSNAASLGEVERRNEVARGLLKTAGQTQARIVESVFNDSLNSLWRDLFVRLAPNEDFVPAFEVSAGARTPNLVTRHRDGAVGGRPGAMLSAGNLNTAALTLFLALHLHASDDMRVLVLDDPVQSMDDVHISQLAALLRVLSKQLGRQIVIAVHERALFEYLQLELSPAFEGDGLIAVELKKQADGTTHAEPTYRTWKADQVGALA